MVLYSRCLEEQCCQLLSYQKNINHALFWVPCLQKSHRAGSYDKQHERWWVRLAGLLSVTCDDALIIPLKSLFLNNQASNAEDRRSAVNTEDVLKHSKPALDGWGGSGCWVDCRERLSKITHQLNVYFQSKLPYPGTLVYLQMCYCFIEVILSGGDFRMLCF